MVAAGQAGGVADDLAGSALSVAGAQLDAFVAKPVDELRLVVAAAALSACGSSSTSSSSSTWSTATSTTAGSGSGVAAAKQNGRRSS
jgi:hypothetical protein